MALVTASLSLLIACFVYWVLQRGYILYWGDAQAHLNNSRSLFDTTAPGFDQLGTVWLPSLHLLILPFVQNDWLWSTGLAGSIPTAICFVVTGTCLYLAARETFQFALSAVIVLLCFALNPNILYLASIPMTESVFLAGLAAELLAIVRFQATQRNRYIVLGICASWFMSLTRYDGWFLIPFVALGFAWSAKQYRLRIFVLMGALASLPVFFWLANCWWETANAFDFINGPYSPAAIQGGKPYPGLHNWPQAVQYYLAAGQLCTGWPLLILGALGAVIALWHRHMHPAFFLLLTPAFYVWSMHSSANPIHVPTLWPFSYYNTRYGIAVFVFCAFAAGALADVLIQRQRLLPFAIPLLAVVPWIIHPSPDHWICWKESEQNSISRRAWTKAGAHFLNANYKSGDGVLIMFGDPLAIFGKAGIPLREAIHEGSSPYWLPAIGAPYTVHPAKWAIALHGDRVSVAINCQAPLAYAMVESIQTKDATLEIYRRIR